MGITFGPGMVRALEAERDRLRADSAGAVHLAGVVTNLEAELNRVASALDAASAHAAEASDYADRYKAERDRLAAVVREAHAAAAELHHASWCSEVLWRGGCSCGVQELTDTLAAAATHQGNPSSVGSGCDGDHGAGTPDPAAAGRPSGRPAPEDCPPGTCPSCDNDRETTAEEET